MSRLQTSLVAGKNRSREDINLNFSINYNNQSTGERGSTR
jgi:hypothetical protein